MPGPTQIRRLTIDGRVVYLPLQCFSFPPIKRSLNRWTEDPAVARHTLRIVRTLGTRSISASLSVMPDTQNQQRRRLRDSMIAALDRELVSGTPWDTNRLHEGPTGTT